MVTKQVNYYIEIPMTYTYNDFDCIISESTLEKVTSGIMDDKEYTLGCWDSWDITFHESPYYGDLKVASIKIVSHDYSGEMEKTLESIEEEVKSELIEISKFTYFIKLAEENRLNLTEEEL